MLSTQTGRLGFNLTAADTVIFYDSDWNPIPSLQAEDQVYHSGQTKEVQVFRFIAEHTVEEKVAEVGKRKYVLDPLTVVQGRVSKVDPLSVSEMEEIVGFGASEMLHLRRGTYQVGERFCLNHRIETSPTFSRRV